MNLSNKKFNIIKPNKNRKTFRKNNYTNLINKTFKRKKSNNTHHRKLASKLKIKKTHIDGGSKTEKKAPPVSLHQSKQLKTSVETKIPTGVSGSSIGKPKKKSTKPSHRTRKNKSN